MLTMPEQMGQKPTLFRQATQSMNHSRRQVRVTIAGSSWYHSPTARKCRRVLNSRTWSFIQIICLWLALFLPDLWVVCSINDIHVKDGLLMTVMSIFMVEIIVTPIVDVVYCLGFFHFMDSLGTLAMLWEISFMLGPNDTEPIKAFGTFVSTRNIMLLRATRSARVGARMARMSNVLRCLRYSPFQSKKSTEFETQKKGMASTISSRLGDLLATRVACLTILIVIAVPLFDLATWPQEDFGPFVWVQRSGANWADRRYYDTIVELNLMTSFYSGVAYGPYAACPGTWSGGVFHCNSSNFTLSAWIPNNRAPSRGASKLLVTTDNFQICFNMQQPLAVQAGMSILTVCFVISIMVFSGMALTHVVYELAVKPLERMLSTVRKIANTVFKFSAAVTNEENEESNDANEMKLLEKVVTKLATIADLQMQKSVIHNTEDMGDEDLGVLSMMQGRKIETGLGAVRAPSMMVSQLVKRRQKLLVQGVQGHVRIEDFGVTKEVFESWSFCPLEMTKLQRVALTVHAFCDRSSTFGDENCQFTSSDEMALLHRFVQSCASEYLNVPFHNFGHAVDVVHALSRMLVNISAETYLSDWEQLALIVAALGHDLGHPGVNNGFLVEVSHELALQYNDKSPLENMHCAKLWMILVNPGTALFAGATPGQRRDVRKHILEAILHTDMILHQGMVKDLQMIYQMNLPVFSPKPEGAPLSLAEAEIWCQPDNKILVMNMVLHAADVSNPSKVWAVTKAWAMVCLEEFFAQGDKEKELAIPVQFLNDRDKLNRPNSQIGFIEFMIAPFLVAQLRLFPALKEMGDNLGNNLTNWQDAWRMDVKPPPDELKKVKARVEKVNIALTAAAMRAPD